MKGLIISNVIQSGKEKKIEAAVSPLKSTCIQVSQVLIAFHRASTMAKSCYV